MVAKLLHLPQGWNFIVKSHFHMFHKPWVSWSFIDGNNPVSFQKEKLFNMDKWPVFCELYSRRNITSFEATIQQLVDFFKRDPCEVLPSMGDLTANMKCVFCCPRPHRNHFILHNFSFDFHFWKPGALLSFLSSQILLPILRSWLLQMSLLRCFGSCFVAIFSG